MLYFKMANNNVGDAISSNLTRHTTAAQQRLKNLALSPEGIMIANDSAHDANDICFAGIMMISSLSLSIGLLLGFLIAS